MFTGFFLLKVQTAVLKGRGRATKLELRLSSGSSGRCCGLYAHTMLLVHFNVKCAVTYARKLGLYVGRGDEVFFPWEQFSFF